MIMHDGVIILECSISQLAVVLIVEVGCLTQEVETMKVMEAFGRGDISSASFRCAFYHSRFEAISLALALWDDERADLAVISASRRASRD